MPTPTRRPAARSSVERRDPAAEQGVRARAVRDGDAVLGEQGDLLRVDLDAVRRDDALVEQAGGGEAADAALPVRLDEHLRAPAARALAAQQPVELVLALVQVRRDRQVERQAGGVDLARAGVRRVRRDADADALGERGRDVGALLLELAQRVGAVPAEHLEIDDRPQPELGAARARSRRRTRGRRPS